MLKRPDDIHVYGNWNYRGVCGCEYQEAESFFAMLRYQHPDRWRLATHVRNESGKGKTRFQVFKEIKQGMVKGHADIVFGGIPTGYVEMKRRDPALCSWGEGQLEFLREAKARGCFVAVALGADAALEAFRRWLAYSAKMEAALKVAGFDIGNTQPIPTHRGKAI